MNERDDLCSLNLPQSAKSYARMRGPVGTGPRKVDLYLKAHSTILGQPLKGFRNRDTVGPVKLAFKVAEKLMGDA